MSADMEPIEASPSNRDDLESTFMGLREVGHLATWTVSSAKAGNGVDCLRDGRMDTFWQ